MPTNNNRLGRIDEEYRKEISHIIGYELKNPFAKMDFSEHCSDWLPDLTDFRMACYKYDQVYGDLLAKFVYEHLP